MKKRKYWKDVLHAFTSSFGRTISIVFLLALGAMALNGLKVTGPNMHETADEYVRKSKMADFTVTSDCGMTGTEKKALEKLDGVHVELGMETDVTVRNTNRAVRLFSVPEKISLCQLTSGRMPRNSGEIVLGPALAGKYRVGDHIAFTQGKVKLLKKTGYRVTGFAKSADIWSNSSMGSSTVGTGDLRGYGFVTEEAFDSAFHTIARIRVDSLTKHPYYTDAYDDKVGAMQKVLESRLKKTAGKRLEEMQRKPRAELAARRKDLAELRNGIEQAEASGVPAAMLAQRKAQYSRGMELVGKNEKKIDRMAKPSYTVSDRESSSGSDGYGTYKHATDSISNVGNIFPVVLYLVAALVTLTTMTRFVDEERLNAGLLRALGYSKRQVVAKYVIYGLVTSMVGTFAGILIGNFCLSPIISDIVSKDMVIGEEHLYFHLSYTLVTVAAALVSAVLPAYMVARGDLSENPAELMLPKPPASGSRILLERITFIWEKMSFTHKVTARNIFRYKQRMLMTVFGVAGSVALLFAGLGIQSSVSGVSNRQFGQIMKYDMLVFRNGSDRKEVDGLLDRKAKSHEDIRVESLDDKYSSTLFVFPNGKSGGYLDLRNRTDRDRIPLTDSGVVICEKLADLYGVKKGDSIRLKIDGRKVRVRVSGICEMYAGHFIYMTKDCYEKTVGRTYRPDTAIVTLKDRGAENVGSVTASLVKMDGVACVSQNTSLVRQLASVVRSMQTVMNILTLLSVLLAIVILYNLTNINVSERIRELSTIKVLGFHSREVTLYIYRETIVLSLVGIVVGLFGGKLMHHAILQMIGSDFIMFDPSVPLRVWLTPVLAVCLILVALGWLVNRRLRSIDMLEALKSVD